MPSDTVLFLLWNRCISIAPKYYNPEQEVVRGLHVECLSEGRTGTWATSTDYGSIPQVTSTLPLLGYCKLFQEVAAIGILFPTQMTERWSFVELIAYLLPWKSIERKTPILQPHVEVSHTGVPRDSGSEKSCSNVRIRLSLRGSPRKEMPPLPNVDQLHAQHSPSHASREIFQGSLCDPIDDPAQEVASRRWHKWPNTALESKRFNYSYPGNQRSPADVCWKGCAGAIRMWHTYNAQFRP
jgi:hypothetical protein